MTQYAKDAGVWKPVSNGFIKDAGVWKTIARGYAKDAGVWKPFGYQFTSNLDMVSVIATPGTTSLTVSNTTTAPAGPDRYAVIAVQGDNTISATINGTPITRLNPGGGNVLIGYALVPTGSTITTVVSQGGGGAFTMQGAVVCFNKSEAPVLVQRTSGSGTSSASSTFTRPANGFAFAYALSGDTPTGNSGMSDVLQASGIFNVVSGIVPIDTSGVATSLTVSASFSGSNNSCAVNVQTFT